MIIFSQTILYSANYFCWDFHCRRFRLFYYYSFFM